MSDMAYKVSFLCLLITAAKAGDVPSFQVPVNANQPTNIQITVTAVPANAPANSLHAIRYTPAFEHQQQYNPNALTFAPPQLQFSPIQYNSIAAAPVQAQPAFHIRAIPIQLAPQPVHLASRAAPVQIAPAPLQFLTQQPAPIQSPFQIVAKKAEYNPPAQVETKPVQVPPLQFQLRQLQVPVQVQFAPEAPVAVQPAAVVKKVKYVEKEEFDANPQYEYGYDVDDAQTGDSKSQSEQRQGNFVRGSYSVIDPDGHKRTVEYTADPIHGFSAVVRREPVHPNGLLLRKVDVSRNYNQ